MGFFDDIQDISSGTKNAYLDRAKTGGARVLGYFCSYIPEEIITAAGMVPYRMRAVGSSGTSLSDAYYSPMNCTFPRNCFDKVLRGDFDFLDGVIFMNSCDHTRRMHDNWRHCGRGPSFIHMLYVPHVISHDGLDKYIEGLESLKTGIESHFGVKISGSDLEKAIALHNTRRRLIRSIYDARRSPAIRIRASELLRLMMSVTAMPVEDGNILLERALQEIDGRDVSSPGEVRVFLSGGCVEEPSHIEMIESMGAAIVADYLCLGARYADGDVETGTDPLEAIARRYYGHISCPRMMNDTARRFSYIRDTMSEYNARALIAEKLKFCMLFFGETFLYREESKKHGFPLLVIEREYGEKTEGQQKTRIQAFIEQIRNFM